MFRDVALAGETGGTHMVVKAHGKAVKQPPESHQWLVYVRSITGIKSCRPLYHKTS